MLKEKFHNLISDRLLLRSCILNLILCACMSFFYIDSGKKIEPLLYAIFFLSYVICVFVFGRKCIPVMYLIFAAGATQDTVFINCTCFFILIGVVWVFPKWKIPVSVVYTLEIIIVCFRHGKTVFHLLAHFAFCIIFYLFAELVRTIIINRACENLTSKIEPLMLEEKEEIIIRQLAEGKLQKEITDFSKNTKHKYISNAMRRNNCSTPEELVARYAIATQSQAINL